MMLMPHWPCIFIKTIGCSHAQLMHDPTKTQRKIRQNRMSNDPFAGKHTKISPNSAIHPVQLVYYNCVRSRSTERPCLSPDPNCSSLKEASADWPKSSILPNLLSPRASTTPFPSVDIHVRACMPVCFDLHPIYKRPQQVGF